MALPPVTWMSSGEAADYLGITTRTLYKFIDDGSLPGYRFGRVIRLKAAEVEAFVESRRIEPGTLEHLHPEVAEH
ncbi:MAG: helix-turn-helix domain-containing protein [Acidimicrobiales bacterium]|jgi:excisionase family DNA binding protein|nr:helix-turn-helix domain-containing protein [Acidimicrobiales bacterium]